MIKIKIGDNIYDTVLSEEQCERLGSNLSYVLKHNVHYHQPLFDDYERSQKLIVLGSQPRMFSIPMTPDEQLAPLTKHLGGLSEGLEDLEHQIDNLAIAIKNLQSNFDTVSKVFENRLKLLENAVAGPGKTGDSSDSSQSSQS